MWRFLITWLVCLSAGAATYFVDPVNGNDGNSGLSGHPWLTISHAAGVVMAGDTVNAGPGLFNERVAFTTSGTTGSPITWNGVSPVTNMGNFLFVNNSNNIVQNFDFVLRGLNSYVSFDAIVLLTNTTAITIANNHFHDSQGAFGSAIKGEVASGNDFGVTSASSIVISNNLINDWGAFNGACIEIHGGTNWLVVNNTVSNTFGGDFIRPWGGGHIIRGNIIKQLGDGIARTEGAGNASFNGFWYFNTNAYNSFSATYGGPALTNAAGFLFIEGDGGASWTDKWNLVAIDRSITYASAPNNYGPWTLRNAAIVSAPTNSQVANDHPDFLQVWGSFDSSTNVTFNPLQRSTNNLIENNWVEANWGGTSGQINDAVGTNASVINNFLWRNNVFIGCNSASIDAQFMKYHNNLFINCGSASSGSTSLAFGWNEPAGSSPRGESWNLEITNNAFIGGGWGSVSGGWYGFPVVGSAGYVSSVNVVTGAYTRCDYNYVAKNTTGTGVNVSAGWGSNSAAFFEPHGVNGGNPNLAYITASVPANGFPLQPVDLHPMLSSVLIDAGAGIETNDMELATRPLGSAVDIGPYEYDPNLLMRLAFNVDDVSLSRVEDITGNAHHGQMMDATNLIQIFGNQPVATGFFTNNGVLTNQYTTPNTYNKGQYLAVTNISVISNIVNGTVAFWGQWITNAIGAQPEPETASMVMDAGDLYTFAGDPAHTTNAWAFQWNYPGLLTNALIFKRWQPSSFTDTSTALAWWPDINRNNTNRFHVCLTWSVTAGTMTTTAYENGVPFLTNTVTAPYLQIGGASPGWLCIGALQHSGTPAWDFPDGQPNAGWFFGQLRDVRLYNRTLSTNDVFNLFSGSSGVSSGGSSPSTPTFTLTVTSVNPASGVNVTVSPTSNDNVSSGSTTFTAIYNSNTTVTATAPGTIGGRTFQQWQQDGVFFTNNVAAIFVMGSAHTMEADYTNSSSTHISGSATLSGNATLKNQ